MNQQPQAPYQQIDKIIWQLKGDPFRIQGISEENEVQITFKVTDRQLEIDICRKPSIIYKT